MDPNPYRPPAASTASPSPAKPASLIVFGILNILFGLLGVCGTAGSSAMFFMELPQDPAVPNPVLELIRSDATYRLFLQVATVLGAVASLALLAAGVGLLLAKAWGRTLSIAYGWYAIVAGVIGLIVNWVYLLQPLFAKLQELQGPAAAGAFGGAIGGMLGGCLGLVYPVVLLAFMGRQSLRAAVAPRAAAR